MTKERKPRTPLRAKRLNILRKAEGMTQPAFSQAIIARLGLEGAKGKDKANVSQQAISKYERNERPLELEAAERIIRAFPSYRLAWLLGDDDYMTQADKSRTALLDARREGALLDGGFRLLAEVAGFSIEEAIDGESVEDVVSHIKEGMLVSRGDMSARLNIDQLNKIENQVLDFAEFLLVKAIS